MSQPIPGCDEIQPKFAFGQIVSTPNALNQIPNDEILTALSRHLQGDWGTLDPEDWNANERALKIGGRFYYDPREVRQALQKQCGVNMEGGK